jgi:hypothetical protein
MLFATDIIDKLNCVFAAANDLLHFAVQDRQLAEDGPRREEFGELLISHLTYFFFKLLCCNIFLSFILEGWLCILHPLFLRHVLLDITDETADDRFLWERRIRDGLDREVEC